MLNSLFSTNRLKQKHCAHHWSDYGVEITRADLFTKLKIITVSHVPPMGKNKTKTHTKKLW